MGRLDIVVGTEIIKIGEEEIRLGHTYFEVEVLHAFLKIINPRYFIEVGMHEGGLSYMLLPPLSSLGMVYVGIELNCDIIRHRVRELFIRMNGVLICDDCFKPNIFDYVKSLTPKVLYCDGGNKAREIIHFKDACSLGDVIMCHDYWDETRKVRGVPEGNISKEVLKSDVQIYEEDESFHSIAYGLFQETRINGWQKR